MFSQKVDPADVARILIASFYIAILFVDLPIMP